MGGDMAALSLKSLPVGFRFSPTDEQLVNHYLKTKISGGKGDINVIPEVDVCKSEPWDLPDKSVIRTHDPEWFFFSPRNRKYPTGHRSKRATEKGYWKATGKDRIIKSRTGSGETVIGMKKTLVFHRGRAPKGEKTCWIMHEYRVTDSALENPTEESNSSQGAYVVCKLFKQLEKKIPSPNYAEEEDICSSPTPTGSPPCDTEHAEAAVEVSEMPSNQETIEPDVQEGFSSFPAAVGKVDEAESAAKYPLKPEDSNGNSNKASEFGDNEGEVELEVFSLVDILDELNGPQPEPIDSEEFPRLDSPVCMDDFFVGFPQVGQAGSHDLDNAEMDEVTEFVDSVLNQDDSSFGGFDDQKDQAIKPVNINMLQWSHWDEASGKDSGSSSDVDSDLRMQAHGLHPDADVSALLLEQSFSSQDLNNSLHWNSAPTESFYNTVGWGHVSQFLDDRTGEHVSYMNSAVPQDSYYLDSFKESTSDATLLSNNNGFEGTGIKIRPSQPQFSAPSPSSQQGTANRRVRLQMDPQVESVCSNGTEESSSSEEHEVCSANTEEQKHAANNFKQHATEKEELFEQASIDNAESHRPDMDSTPAPFEIVGKSDPGLRLRKLSDRKDVKGHPLLKEASKHGPTLIRNIAYTCLILAGVFAVGWKYFKH